MNNNKNIINLEQVADLLFTYSNKKPQMFEFIHGAIKNFLFKKAPSKENYLYFLNSLKRNNTNNVKKILSNGGPFHEILINDRLIKRIDNVLEFLENHPIYLNNKRIGFENMEQLHNKWIASLNKNVSNEEGEVELCYSFDNGTKIVKLIDEKSYQREGYLMQHCVAAYANRKEIEIYSIRTADNKPFITVEVKNSMIKQISENCNNVIKNENKKYINEFALYRKYKFNFINRQSSFCPGFFCFLSYFYLFLNWDVLAKIVMSDKSYLDLMTNKNLCNIVSCTLFFLAFMKTANQSGKKEIKDQI